MSVNDKIEGLTNELTDLSQHLSASSKSRLISRIDGVACCVVREADKEAVENGWADLTKSKDKLKGAIISIQNQRPSQNTDTRNFLFNKVTEFLTVLDWFIDKKEGKPVPEEPPRLKEKEKEPEEESELSEMPKELGNIVKGGGEKLPT